VEKNFWAEPGQEVLKRFPSAVGLEMEIFGLYTAVEGGIGRRPEFIALKTAADFGTSAKKDDAQKLASACQRLVCGSVP